MIWWYLICVFWCFCSSVSGQGDEIRLAFIAARAWLNVVRHQRSFIFDFKIGHYATSNSRACRLPACTILFYGALYRLLRALILPQRFAARRMYYFFRKIAMLASVILCFPFRRFFIINIVISHSSPSRCVLATWLQTYVASVLIFWYIIGERISREWRSLISDILYASTLFGRDEEPRWALRHHEK